MAIKKMLNVQIEHLKPVSYAQYSTNNMTCQAIFYVFKRIAQSKNISSANFLQMKAYKKRRGPEPSSLLDIELLVGICRAGAANGQSRSNVAV